MKEPRPFWVESQIGSWDWICPVDFGSPSGHSFFIFAMYEPILSDILGTGKGVQLVLLVLIAVAVMASRMYLGAHSLNEVIFGAVLGCVYLVIYHYKLQQFFYQVIADILNKRHRLFYFIGNTIACLSFILLSLILYQINMENK
jgi:membrane-associated phospholipid phosphatase